MEISALASSNLFFSIGLLLIVAAIIGFLMRLLKQPLIPAYVLSGVLLGPFGFALIKESNIVAALSEIGIAFLLFIVGLEINLRKLREVGVISCFIGVIQVGLVFLIGFLIAKGFNFLSIEAVYLGLIFAFSSTMIVVKLLSDKNELSTLHGRIILAVLLVQDIIVIFVLSMLGSFSNFGIMFLWQAFFKGLILFMVAIILSKFFLPPIFEISAKSREFLFLTAVAVCFFFSILAYYLGFSIAIGAFLAGLALSSLPYHFDIAGRIIPIRDFFVILFFVSLGMELVLEDVKGILVFLLISLVIIMILKPLIIMVMGSVFGYKKRTSFLSALSLAQISEFSLILASFGLSLGHISSNIFTLTVLLAIITITLTSYFIQYDNKIYGVFSRNLDIFEKLAVRERELEHLPHYAKKEIIIFGAHRMGHIFVNTFSKFRENMVVVDFDPQIIIKLIKKKIPCIYGDVANEEVLKRLHLESAKLVISTIPDDEDNAFLIKYIKNKNPKAVLIVTSAQVNTALDLYDKGADYVIVPHLLSGEMMAELLKEITERKKDVSELRMKAIKYLKEEEF